MKEHVFVSSIPHDSECHTSLTSSQLYPSPVYPSGQGPHSSPSSVSMHISSRKHTPGVHFGFTTSDPPSPRNVTNYVLHLVANNGTSWLSSRVNFWQVFCCKFAAMLKSHLHKCCLCALARVMSYHRPGTQRWCF